jgi:F420-dependent oxidoreductase-like protein
MEFSVWPGLGRPWIEILELSRHAEATGWDGVWAADHFFSKSGGEVHGTLECFSVLTAIAAEVPRVRLGSLVAGNTYRHPAVLANIAATIDSISDGRFMLGLGAGWQKDEHDAYGIEYPSVRERLDRLEEACIIIRSLFANTSTTFSGRYYSAEDAPLEPRPVQRPLPLMIGGGGEKRTMKIAAQYADRWNYWGTPDVVRRKLEVLDAHCADVGRNPAEITRTAQVNLYMSDDRTWLEQHRKRLEGLEVGAGRRAIDSAIIGTPAELVDVVAKYVEIGIDELMIPDSTFGDLDDRKRLYDAFKEKVIDKLR